MNGHTPVHPTMGPQSVDYLGLTKREYFAGQALTGILAGYWDAKSEVVADVAVKMADALLKRLEGE